MAHGSFLDDWGDGVMVSGGSFRNDCDDSGIQTCHGGTLMHAI